VEDELRALPPLVFAGEARRLTSKLAQVERGEQPTGLRDFAAIHAAIPTDSTVKGPVFTAFAEAYLESVRQLEASDSSSVFRFNRMVDQCMNCHSEFCPGPKKRIRKLYLKE
jgi:hypothetical protein